MKGFAFSVQPRAFCIMSRLVIVRSEVKLVCWFINTLQFWRGAVQADARRRDEVDTIAYRSRSGNAADACTPPTPLRAAAVSHAGIVARSLHTTVGMRVTRALPSWLTASSKIEDIYEPAHS
jgi:hypothetical protein